MIGRGRMGRERKRRGDDWDEGRGREGIGKRGGKGNEEGEEGNRRGD